MTKSDSKKSCRGRPRVAIDWRVVEQLCSIFCTKDEICSVLGVSDTTLDNRLKAEFGMNFLAFRDQKSAKGKASLRHLQFQSAKAGSVAMLIWLGKQWLGQTERIEQMALSDPLQEIVAEFRKRSDILERTASSEDPIPGEAPSLTIH